MLAVPTGVEAERLAADLREFLGADAVELFPAWETLPFERVSPAIETMGRRLRVIWRLRVGGDHLPAVVVAPVRALVQRLGPHVEAVEPVVVKPGAQLDRDELVEQLVTMGYRREYQVEARGELAVRGAIVDVYPSTADHPGAHRPLGRRGRPPVAVLGRRPALDASTSTTRGSSPCASCSRPRRCRSARPSCSTTQPWGAEQWERLAEGQTFDGMESWLPWLSRRRAPAARPAAVERGRRAVRAAPPARPRAGAARRGGRARRDAGEDVGRDARSRRPRRACRCRSTACSRTRRRRPCRCSNAPDNPDTPALAATAFDPVVGDTDALGRRLTQLRADGFRVFIAAEGSGSADRIEQLLVGRGRDRRPRRARSTTTSPALRAPGVHVVVAPLDRGVVLPGVQLAIVAEADLTGRRRVHRRPRGARRGADYYEGLAKGDFVVHRVHGVGRYFGMETREMFGITRDRLVVEFKGGDRVYVDSEDIGLIRKYTGGETPKLSKMGGADWEKTRAGVRRAVRDIAGELVVLYRRRLATPGHAFAADGPFQTQIEESFPYEETPDQAQAIIDTKADMERPIPMDRLVCGDVGYGKTEVALRAAAKAVFDGKQVAILVPTTLLASQHGQTFRERFANYPVRVEVLSRFLSAKEQTEVVRGVQDGTVDIVIGTHRLLSERHEVQGSRAARGRRGAAVRRAAQGTHQGDAHERRHPHAHRDADPAHARDVAHRHPRSLAREHAARGSPADPHLRRRARSRVPCRRRSGASCCARARCSTCTTA